MRGDQLRTLYLDCSLGAAGDMLAGALLELLPEPERFIEEVNALGIPHVRVSRQIRESAGIAGTHYRVEIDGNGEEDGHAHGHRKMAEIEPLISGLPVSEAVRRDAQAIYASIAEAESRVHGKPVTAVHFHEVGALDAIADVVSVCMLMERLEPDQILASRVCVGWGQVECAHGTLPVPAPATALLLKGVPAFGGNTEGEMCTPTGAALLRHFSKGFGALPAMTTEALGIGLGSRNYGGPSFVRAFIGESDAAGEQVAVLSCNLDDMTPEAIGFAQERLMKAGALDVWTQAIGMKKSRPGVMLCCLCRIEDEDEMVNIILKYTTSLGIRVRREGRVTLQRSFKTVETPHGPVTVKTAKGRGVVKSKPEYEDLARIAREQGISLLEAAELVWK